jgi:threonine aldolase
LVKSNLSQVKASAKKRCKKFLSYDYPQTAQQRLLDLARYVDADTAMDRAGRGELVEQLEKRLTSLLDKEAVVFMASGKMAQLIALKIWTERRQIPRIAIHPRSHIEDQKREHKAYQEVYDLKATWIGDYDRCTTITDLSALAESVGAISLEIPLRALGCVLPPLNELKVMSEWARERDIPFHADAARLWEIAPYYGCSHAEIAKLFDSLYVSLYKGLGGIAGAALAGPSDLISEAKQWQVRLGGRLPKQFPMLIDALRGLETRLPLMAAFHDKARELAAAISSLPGVWVTPNPPHANAMIVALQGEQDRLVEAGIEVAERTGLWLFDLQVESPIQGIAMFEVTVRGATLDVSAEEAVKAILLLRDLLHSNPDPIS